MSNDARAATSKASDDNDAGGKKARDQIFCFATLSFDKTLIETLNRSNKDLKICER